MAKRSDKAAQYVPIIVHVFRKYWAKGTVEFEFHRDELVEAAEAVGVERPDNLGDVIYSFKFRRDLPAEILKTAPKGKAWIIEGAGRSLYRFRLVEAGGTTIRPREDIAATKIPDSTPEIIGAYALGDEQALLAKVRYNRLIDIFLGLTTYSLQKPSSYSCKGYGTDRNRRDLCWTQSERRPLRDTGTGERWIGQAFARTDHAGYRMLRSQISGFDLPASIRAIHGGRCHSTL